MENSKSYFLKIRLEQMSPIIHFEHKEHEHGATLRATEVKPKLDRFIVKYCEDHNIKVEDNWFIDKDENKALNYKMRIQIIGNITSETLTKSNETEKILIKKRFYKGNEREKPSIQGSFFGNMISPKQNLSYKEKINYIKNNTKESLYYTNEIEITMFCFKNGLIKLIKNNVIGFFLLNNFGTRQNKGYGSFKVTHINDIAQTYNLEETISTYEKDCWYIKNNTSYITSKNTRDTALKDIKMIYGFMKGGHNFTRTYNRSTQRMIESKTPKDYFRGYIYKYFNNQNIKNDKAFVKQVVLKEKYKIEKKGEVKAQGTEYRFVRAMLGLPGTLDFKNKNDDVDETIEEKIYVYNNAKIKRYASPILFKIVDDYIFIIPRKVNKAILDKDFYLTTKSKEKQYLEKPNDEEKITTPKEFDLIKFLDGFQIYFNDKESKKDGDIGIIEAQNKDLIRAKYLMIKRVGESK